MRVIAIVALCIASLAANPYIDPDPASTEMGALVPWPTARSTALAGAMTGLADEADATYFNPAGLAFQTTAKADLSYSNWLPGLFEGMYYAYASGGAPLRLRFLHERSAYLAGSIAYMTVGEGDVVNEHGDFLGRVNVWRGWVAVQMAMPLTNRLGAGVGLKVAHSTYYDDWSVVQYGKATAPAADLALLYRPLSCVSMGAMIANLGPTMVYRPGGGAFSMPRIARLGLYWTPIESRKMRLRVMPELDKVLVGMFSDTTGKSFGAQLGDEWKDIWKAFGIEATAFNLVSVRLGYIEDVTNQRGGIVMERDDETYHYGIWDILTKQDLGEFSKIGLCWGFGVAYKGYLRFDVSSDAAIYDFPTSNWKLQLTCNDIGRLFGKRS